MSIFKNVQVAALLSCAALLSACASDSVGEEDVELNESRQTLVTTNGLRTINGLRTVNGLISTNGLTTTNGLRTVNGMRTVNGLRTVNGMRTVNGLDTDCTGKTAGVSCSGEPDGLLDNRTGLMASDDGVITASYLVRCALPKGDSIRVKDYTGGLVTLNGELGLTPGWKDGQCDGVCQEKISACLMAFTNGDGVHVPVEFSASYTLGTGHSKDFPYQEGAFYGNLFTDPPEAYYCVGADFAVAGISVKLLETRSCKGYNDKTGTCPYKRVGFCNSVIGIDLSGLWSGNSADSTLTGDKKCDFGGLLLAKGDTAKSCKSGGSGLLSGKSWKYPITTFRKTKQ